MTENTREPVTVEHIIELTTADRIIELAKSDVRKVALVRYPTGKLSVRSATPGYYRAYLDTFTVVCTPYDFYALSGLTDEDTIPWWPDMTTEEAQVIADRLNEMGR